MMNVKKYRAASTREALEQIKNELGEHALVLETKQVRKSGFLGLGSGTQIEISAALPAGMEVRPKPAPKVFNSTSILNLTDDAPAAPKSRRDDAKNSLMAALSARTATSGEMDRDEPLVANRGSKVDTVEISTAAPKVVHPRREAARSFVETAATATGDMSTGNNRELELLRAELREIKFSVNSFAGRQSATMFSKESDLDLLDEIFESPYYETYMELAETGIPSDLARSFITGIIPHCRERGIEPSQLAYASLFKAVSHDVKFVPDALHEKGSNVVAVIGATGVGKTTTIAKLAARAALKERRRVELVTLDTYRIAAVEQLKTYAEIIGAGCHVVRTVLELDGLIHRLADDALVLIDTTGKNPHDLADQYELSDYLKSRDNIRKCLAVQSTTHPVDAVAGIRKFEMYGADSLILTKLDETLRPGALLEVINDANLPLAYLCHGQRVPEDIQIATPDSLTNRILGKN